MPFYLFVLLIEEEVQFTKEEADPVELSQERWNFGYFTDAQQKPLWRLVEV